MGQAVERLQAQVLAAYQRFDAGQQALSDRMIRYWTRFAAAGDPNQAGVDPAWPAYAAGADASQLLQPGATGARGDFYRDHKCSFWAGPYP